MMEPLPHCSVSVVFLTETWYNSVALYFMLIARNDL